MLRRQFCVHAVIRYRMQGVLLSDHQQQQQQPNKPHSPMRPASCMCMCSTRTWSLQYVPCTHACAHAFEHVCARAARCAQPQLTAAAGAAPRPAAPAPPRPAVRAPRASRQWSRGPALRCPCPQPDPASGAAAAPAAAALRPPQSLRCCRRCRHAAATGRQAGRPGAARGLWCAAAGAPAAGHPGRGRCGRRGARRGPGSAAAGPPGRTAAGPQPASRGVCVCVCVPHVKGRGWVLLWRLDRRTELLGWDSSATDPYNSAAAKTLKRQTL